MYVIITGILHWRQSNCSIGLVQNCMWQLFEKRFANLFKIGGKPKMFVAGEDSDPCQPFSPKLPTPSSIIFFPN